MLVHRYAGRQIALATRHGKERMLARPLWHGLGLGLSHAVTVDTDAFGSFSGEPARVADALTTCAWKAEAAMDALGLDLGIASEGSFGPHPAVPMLAMGKEWMVVVDRRDGLLIHEQRLSGVTNFSSCLGSGPEMVVAWLREVGFPSHAVMVKAHDPEAPGEGRWLAKGVRCPRELAERMRLAVAQSPVDLARVETDMRAHCNPTRRAEIRRLAFRLVRRLATPCPACTAPGWGPIATVPGLPCRGCGLATELVWLEEWGCGACRHRERRPRRDGLELADPGQCAYCNP